MQNDVSILRPPMDSTQVEPAEVPILWTQVKKAKKVTIERDRSMEMSEWQ
jgi:hypothetical protein